LTIDYCQLSIGNWKKSLTTQVHSFPLKAGLKAGIRLTASHRKRYLRQAASSSGGVAFFILLDIVGEPMNGSSYAQCATLRYLKTVQFSSVNLEP
jgi:hypothetical protein